MNTVKLYSTNCICQSGELVFIDSSWMKFQNYFIPIDSQRQRIFPNFNLDTVVLDEIKRTGKWALILKEVKMVDDFLAINMMRQRLNVPTIKHFYEALIEDKIVLLTNFVYDQ